MQIIFQALFYALFYGHEKISRPNFEFDLKHLILDFSINKILVVVDFGSFIWHVANIY